MDKFYSEEDVKIKHVVPFLEERGYPRSNMSFNKPMKIWVGCKPTTIYADVIVYKESYKQTPHILIETKSPDHRIDKSAIEQAKSYARNLYAPPRYIWITNARKDIVIEWPGCKDVYCVPYANKKLSGAEDGIRRAISFIRGVLSDSVFTWDSDNLKPLGVGSKPRTGGNIDPWKHADNILDSLERQGESWWNQMREPKKKQTTKKKTVRREPEYKSEPEYWNNLQFPDRFN